MSIREVQLGEPSLLCVASTLSPLPADRVTDVVLKRVCGKPDPHRKTNVVPFTTIFLHLEDDLNAQLDRRVLIYPSAVPLFVPIVGDLKLDRCQTSAGEDVLAYDARAQAFVYSPVFGFAVRNNETRVNFLRISAGNHSLTITRSEDPFLVRRFYNPQSEPTLGLLNCVT